MTHTLQGMSTVRFSALDLEAARSWYSELLGIEPYFDRPGYIEFRIGAAGHELGIMDARFLGELGNGAAAARPSGVVLYWHVDDLTAMLDRLVDAGATILEPAREFGEGFVAASVVDPFGNILGVMYNQHFVDVQSARA